MKKVNKGVGKSRWQYTDLADLLSYQIEITRLSYDTNSDRYAEAWEWSRQAIKVTAEKYIKPFVKYVRPGKSVLVVGCGTGRDLNVLTELGYRCLGVDSSAGMIREAVDKRKVNCPIVCVGFEELDLADKSFDGVLVDSAIEHMKKSNMGRVMEKIYRGLRERGICLLRFRLGTGRVFFTEDTVGRRYFTTYTRKETRKIVEEAGFEVLNEYECPHLDLTRPGFLTYILRK